MDFLRNLLADYYKGRYYLSGCIPSPMRQRHQPHLLGLDSSMMKKETSAGMLLLVLLIHVNLVPIRASRSIPSEALPGCQSKCGSVSIPYPFGIGKGCYLDDGYNITCDHEHNRTFQGTGNVEILNISHDAPVIINGMLGMDCYNSSGGKTNYVSASTDLRESPFWFSATRNVFTAIGCDTIAFFSEFEDQNFLSGCVSVCNDNKSVIDGSCSGIGCCQTPIPHRLKRYNVTLDSVYQHTKSFDYNPCSYGFFVDKDSFSFQLSDLSAYGYFSRPNLPVVLDWAIGNQTCDQVRREDPASYACGPNSSCNNSDNGPGYRCYCNQGYQGNPYLPQGCQDIDECEVNPCEGLCSNTIGSYTCSCKGGYHGDGRKDGSGCTLDTKSFPVIIVISGIGLGFLFLFASTSWLYWALKRRRLIKLREKFFQQNGGMVLQQQIARRRGVSEIAKIFTVQDMERATNNYDKSRVLGQGGYGTVYKGILPDDRVVAIKKSKIMNQSQIIQFINEVDILSQINHRNVVKLLGCCLETEVPLLVYEFISNGTLFQHIHDERHATSLSWENRLRIAAETAGSLAYLHSAHSIPILHRDIKSANILLDDNYTTKVSDFGASRLVPLEETQMTTLVQGTLGYLDPECFQTGQLTDKSDVYSFGVVLAELLTGEMPLSSERSEAHRSLAMYFIASIKEDRLFQILEDRIVNEGQREQLVAVAELTRRCLKLKGEERPTMKQVAAELEGLRKFQEHPWVQGTQEETESLLGEPSNPLVGNASGQDSMESQFMISLEIAR